MSEVSVRQGAKTGESEQRKSENPALQGSREVCEKPVQCLLPTVVGTGRVCVSQEQEPRLWGEPWAGSGRGCSSPASPREQRARGSARRARKKQSLRQKMSISQGAGQLHTRVIYLWVPEEEPQLIFAAAKPRVLD